ncbi:MAG: SDR family NAD(P)-dependent oxidoreductase [Polyangiaceae bacterium]
MGRRWDRVLDKTVVLSFDASGFERHRRSFVDGELDVDLSGKTCLVTGANSGLGYATARGLALRGASVMMLCRNPERGRSARLALVDEVSGAGAARVEERVELAIVDLSELSSIRAFAERLEARAVDVLVHNAGALPDQYAETSDELELTLATHVVGPFLLSHLLLPRLRAAEHARVIWVSSGGMYTQRLDVSALTRPMSPYDGVKAYAATKRAQVVLSELFAQRWRDEVDVNAMHPGWAATPGVEQSLPRFARLLGKRLRSAEQGADTILWLAAAKRLTGTSGGFYFDRQAVTTHLLPATRESDEARAALWNTCMSLSKLEAAEV